MSVFASARRVRLIPARRMGLALLALALAAGVSWGYRTNSVRWPGAVAHLHLDTSNFPDGSPAQQALVDALGEWNAVAGSEMVFTHDSRDDSGAQDHSDAKNGVDISAAVQPSALAVTYWASSGGLLTSADVLFRDTVNWSSSGAPGAAQHDLRSTARHEFGHALGLGHSQLGCAESVMGEPCGRPGEVRPLHADDEAGARSLYPGTSRTPATLPAPRVDWWLSAPRLNRASALPGESVELSFTLRNAGSKRGDRAPLRYLLSINRDLGPQDTLLLDVPARGSALTPGAALIYTQPLRVPSGTTPGTYWIGVVADPDDLDRELDETNGVVALQLTVRAASTPTTTSTTTSTTTTTPTPATPQVDWAVENVSVTPDSAVPGATVTLRWTVRNVGTATAQELPPVVLYRSDNRTLTRGDHELARRPAQFAAFAPGASVSDSLDVTLSPSTGTFYVGPHVDPDNRAAEPDERNNASGARLTVGSSGCSLLLGSAQSAPRESLLVGLLLMAALLTLRRRAG